MKIKTSITLSEKIIKQIDNYQNSNYNRSQFLEDAAILYLKHLKNKERDKKDLKIIIS